MSENNAIRIAKVKYTGDYTLRLQWANEKELTVDLREPVFRLKGLRPLRDTAAFALAGAGEGGHSVVWPGAIDMGAARLLEMALEQNGRADAVEFIRWRWKHGLSSVSYTHLDVYKRQIMIHANGKAIQSLSNRDVFR